MARTKAASFDAQRAAIRDAAARLFADKVLPTLQRDPAYAGPKRAAAAPGKRAAHGDIFAPA